MELRAIVEGLCGFRGRSAGSDAERRAAVWLRDRLAAAGRDAAFEVHWVRPHWPAVLLVYALAGAGGGLLSTVAAVPGVALAAAAWAGAAVEVTGRPTPARLITFRRATQNVVAPPPRAHSRRVRLVVVAAYDAARTGLAFGSTLRRADAALRRATRGLWPAPLAWLVLALALVTAVAVARAAGAEPGWLAAVQLAPTVVLLVAAAMLADIALSDPSPDAAGASAVAVALALVATLDEQPPSQLDVELVLAGAGDGPALGAGAYVRRRRRRWDAARVALLEIRPAEAGRPAFWVKDGPLVALRLHPRLIELAVACARAEPHLGATPQRGRDNSAAYRARRARWPALAVGALDDRGIVPRRRGGDDQPHSIELEAMEATLAFCLALVAALDEDLAGRQDAGTRQEASA